MWFLKRCLKKTKFNEPLSHKNIFMHKTHLAPTNGLLHLFLCSAAVANGAVDPGKGIYKIPPVGLYVHSPVEFELLRWIKLLIFLIENFSWRARMTLVKLCLLGKKLWPVFELIVFLRAFNRFTGKITIKQRNALYYARFCQE